MLYEETEIKRLKGVMRRFQTTSGKSRIWKGFGLTKLGYLLLKIGAEKLKAAKSACFSCVSTMILKQV